jgi:hypothetical protein
MVDPAKPLGTANEAATWPPAVAVAVVSTVAPKLTSTGSAGPNPRQARVTRAPAGPVLGEMAQVALAGLTVVAVDSVVGWVVEAAVGVVVEAEEEAAAVWSAVREVQPVPARAAMKRAVAMIRTGRMVIPPNSYDPVSPRQQPSRGRSQHGHRSVSR